MAHSSHPARGVQASSPPAVTAVEHSDNAKLGGLSATYVSQASCPPTCPFLGCGCYGEQSLVGIITRRLNRSPERDADDLAGMEAEAIDRLTGMQDLRLHVVGDARTRKAARRLAQASARYRKRGRRGSKVYTYTHAWLDVPRKDWGDVSVLASCESPDQVRMAWARGYAAAIVVPLFESEAAFEYGGVKVIPCPYETRRIPCSRCRLCMDDGRLLKARLAIGFVPHGANAARVRMPLPVVNQEEHP